jgi:hypothetical protein
MKLYFYNILGLAGRTHRPFSYPFEFLSAFIAFVILTCHPFGR